MLDQELLELLACPDCSSRPPLEQKDAQTLRCTQCGRLFDITDHIIQLMPSGVLDPADLGDD